MQIAASRRRVLREYGAVFVASKNVRIPTRCIFLSSEEVDKFHASLKTRKEILRGTPISLRPRRWKTDEGCRRYRGRRQNSTPDDGSTAAKRNYGDTEYIWSTRFLSGLSYWTAKRRITKMLRKWLATPM